MLTQCVRAQELSLTTHLASTRVTGPTTKEMALVSNDLAMETSMRESTQKEKFTDKENMSGSQGSTMKGSGQWEIRMVTASGRA